MSLKQVHFRFYEELNDFLPEKNRKVEFNYIFRGNPSVKDAIEAVGVPHVEVDLILVKSHSVNFRYHLNEGDTISVYPVFESMDIGPVIRLRRKPLRRTRFILDVHLGKLARYLRMLGFDTLYQTDYDDPEIIRIAVEEKRIILTRDLGILKNDLVQRGYWLRSQNAREQLMEVLNRLQLQNKIDPLSRCILCNGKLKQVSMKSVMQSLETNTKKYYEQFFRCRSCGKVFWEGSHVERMKKFLEGLGVKYMSR
jgi:uncharacterized protein